MHTRLAGKVAIVTGGGRGLGEGIALRLAGEGARVVVAEYDPETAHATARRIRQREEEAHAYPVDISDVLAVQKMVVDVVDHYGQIDILINNAGVVQTHPMLDLTEADWDRVIDINQRGTFFCLQAVAQQMIRQIPEVERQERLADVVSLGAKAGPQAAPLRNHGKIVNLSSIAGRRGRPLSAHYAASKAAIISITQSAALALAPYNITVNAVCPGIVPTPMWDQIDTERSELFDTQRGEALRTFVSTVPLRRAGTSEDVAGAVAFFCSTDADYITGQALNVDGGFEMN